MISEEFCEKKYDIFSRDEMVLTNMDKYLPEYVSDYLVHKNRYKKSLIIASFNCF